MLKVTMILDNKIESPQSKTEFTYNYYLTSMAKKDIVKIWIEQGDDELLCSNAGLHTDTPDV